MSDEQPKSFLTDRNRSWAKRSAMHYLGSYSSSVENLRKTVARRAANRFEGIPEQQAAELADAAVRFCIDNGFLDDASYAGTKVASGLRKGHSRRRIAAGLARKGVDPEAVSAALEETDDLASAIVFARKRRLGPWRAGEPDAKLRQKEAAAFGRNGFSGEIAFRIISMHLDEAEEIAFTHPR